ncbi:hypothetical protein Pmani_026971 [Petrolisthes manimaculis]|uniref:Uncharacterized protein n=1 Tax=Petrolisthes manimaculis TaxID=1843537 RepID=A0AAE1P4Y9_9EUCA|nr:hypothetical protein Pmani_026971 [Petrolisthes manimaculis]
MDLCLPHPINEGEEHEGEQMKEEHVNKLPIYKLVNRKWKALPDQGEDVYIRDPKLKEGHLGNLSNKTVIELEEVLARQHRILNNKHLISKLKDRGESLQKRCEEVAQALEAARQRERTVINGERIPDINAMEWRGCVVKPREREELDSDDDDDGANEEKLNPLKLMAYHASSVKKPAGGGGRRDEEDPAEAVAKELQRLILCDDATSQVSSTQAHNTLTKPPSTLAHEPVLTAPSTPVHETLLTAPLHKSTSASLSTTVHETIATPPSTPSHENYTTAPSTPVHKPGITTQPASTHNNSTAITPSYTPTHNTCITPTTQQDFGSKRIQMMEEKKRKNQFKREPFKPYKPCSNPHPLPELFHHARPVNDRPVICLSQKESVRLEQQYVLKEKRHMVTQQVSALRLGSRTVTPAHKYHDANVMRHLLDPDIEDEDWLEDTHRAMPLSDFDDE